jgi:hypothetical protein
MPTSIVRLATLPFACGVTSPKLCLRHNLQSSHLGYQCLPYWQPDNAHCTPPVAGGEYVWGIVPFRHMVEARSVDVVMIDLVRVGGITQWLKVAGMAGRSTCRWSAT